MDQTHNHSARTTSVLQGENSRANRRAERFVSTVYEVSITHYDDR
jgi:hypothetical protein